TNLRCPRLCLKRPERTKRKGKSAQVTGVPADLDTKEGVDLLFRDLPTVDIWTKAQGTDAASFEAEFFRTVRPSSLLKRFETPEEVAAMVVYVCSPRASATNGSALRVDGGVVRSIVRIARGSRNRSTACNRRRT